MKIEQKDRSFSPITLTIESQEELDLLSDLFCLVCGEVEDERLVDTIEDVVCTLNDLGANQNYTYIDGFSMLVIAK